MGKKTASTMAKAMLPNKAVPGRSEMTGQNAKSRQSVSLSLNHKLWRKKKDSRECTSSPQQATQQGKAEKKTQALGDRQAITSKACGTISQDCNSSKTRSAFFKKPSTPRTALTIRQKEGTLCQKGVPKNC
ncbi:MAG: hypothetical protein IKO41_01875 [Lachnospiraceae bacterium]|nr:hypothetical protein [Lachnospiraceae bacterium]